jgi:hypothetical protein
MRGNAERMPDDVSAEHSCARWSTSEPRPAANREAARYSRRRSVVPLPAPRAC